MEAKVERSKNILHLFYQPYFSDDKKKNKLMFFRGTENPGSSGSTALKHGLKEVMWGRRGEVGTKMFRLGLRRDDEGVTTKGLGSQVRKVHSL